MSGRVVKATWRVLDPDDPSVTHELSASFHLPRKKARSEADQTQAILDQAVAFFMAGSRCELDIYLTPEVSISTDTASIVCYSLACELYLKLLGRISKVEPRKVHELLKLFDALPREVQGIMEANYLAHVQRSRDQFRADLAAVSDAFVQWRYKHEFTPIFGAPFRLRDIATVLHRAVRRLAPTLLVTHENRAVAL